jgi:hypothetical protein
MPHWISIGVYSVFGYRVINNYCIWLLSGKLPTEVDITDVPKEPILPKTTELPSSMLSKMKKNTSDSHLFISQHRRTLPARTKQNSDSRLITYHHHQQQFQHKGTECTGDMLPLPLVQETILSAVALDSESIPPPLPPKPIAT